MSWLQQILDALKPKPKPPTPPVEPPPVVVVRKVKLEVHDSRGGSAGQIRGTLGFDAVRAIANEVHDPDFNDHQLVFILPADIPYGQEVSLEVLGDDCAPYEARVVLAETLPGIVLQPPYVPLQRLTIVGKYFRQANGARCFLNGATAFNAYNRYLTEGLPAIRPVLQQRQDLGFNAMRIWTAYAVDLIGRLAPREHSDFYARIPEFAHACETFGQYGYWTGLTGTYEDTLGGADQIVEHDARMMAALAGVSSALYDRQNEYDHAANTAVPRGRLSTPPAGLLWSAGSGQKDTSPPTPYGAFCAFHPASDEWQRKVGKQGDDLGILIPRVDDETVRVESGGEHSPDHCFDAAACGAMFAAGAFFHSAAAKAFQPWTGDELACAQAWCAGARSINLDAVQDGAYSHRTDLETAGIIRSYQRGGVVLSIRA